MLPLSARRLAMILVTAGALSGCGGGGGALSAPPASSVSTASGSGNANGSGLPANGDNVRLSITLPGTAPAAKARKPAFISTGAAGLSVSVYLSSDTAHASPVTVATAAIGAGSPGCSSAAPVSCVIPIAVPPSPADDFVATVYNAAPANGTFPTSAQVLAVGSTTGTAITANAQNAVSLNLLGVPFSATLTFLTGGATVGLSSMQSLDATVFDASSQQIQGTFATPLQLTTTNPSLASFLVNGSAGTTIKASTDTVALTYGGAQGTAKLSLTGTLPFTSSQATFTPTLLAPVATPSTVALGIFSPSTGSFTVYEPYSGGGYTESDTCAGIATITPTSATGNSATFNLTAGFTPGFASCTVTVQDSIGQTVTVSVTLTNYT